MELIYAIVIILVGIIVITLPVKLAAAAMGATRTGFGWCFLALIGASILHSIGLLMPVFGTIIAFLLAAAGFAWFLGTSLIRGIGIAILHVIFAFLISMLISAVLGAGALVLLPISPFFK